MADTRTAANTGADDFLIFGPDDVDLSRSPLRASLRAETFTLGAFNPGFTRLPNGNLIMMVRVAEALREPVVGGHVHSIRWTPGGYVRDAHALAEANMKDPRQFWLTSHHYKTLALTSISWLVPVELTPSGDRIVTIHYDRIIAPAASYQHYGVEDARVSVVDGVYYMTTCSVSAERLCTTLYTSENGLDYELRGVILDHLNKDMLFFEGKVGGRFMALTRPLGDIYLAYPESSEFLPGPSINIATSPDALHWKPLDTPGIRARRRGPGATMKIGGGTPPILTPAGWLTLYHAVEVQGVVGAYRTFWAMLDAEDPSRILRWEDETPLLEARADLTRPLQEKMYLSDIVFSTGIVENGDHYVVASGEADLACRITRIAKSVFE